MNESTRKNLFNVVCLLCVITFGGCRTVTPIIPDTGTGAVTVRDDLAGLTSGQTDLAVTGTEIENGSGQIASGLSDLEQAIIDATGTNGTFEEILRAVRGRPIKAGD